MKLKLNNNISTKQYKYICIFMLILGITLIYLSVNNFIFTKIIKTYDVTTANIISCYNYTNNNEMNEKQSTRTEIKYYFEKDNKIFENKKEIWWEISKKSCDKYKKNTKINVYYNKRNIKNNNIYHNSFVFFILGSIFILFSTLINRNSLKID